MRLPRIVVRVNKISPPFDVNKKVEFEVVIIAKSSMGNVAMKYERVCTVAEAASMYEGQTWDVEFVPRPAE